MVTQQFECATERSMFVKGFAILLVYKNCKNQFTSGFLGHTVHQYEYESNFHNMIHNHDNVMYGLRKCTGI